MQRCTVCRKSKTLIDFPGVRLCRDCGNIFTDLPKDEALARIQSEIEKSEARKAYNKQMQALQEERTAKHYLHFQIRFVQ